MGKKTRQVNYDKSALLNLAEHIKSARQPLNGNKIQKLRIDLKGLESTVKGLPKKERELMEKFWGLIPGTAIQARNAAVRVQKDIAFKSMLDKTYRIVEKMFSMEYLIQFDPEARKVVDELIPKFDKSGCGDMTDVDALKYFILFLVFLTGGTKMIYESGEDKMMTDEEEKIGYFDQYSLLEATLEGSARDMPDKSIRIKLIILFLEMFDLKDVVSMKKYANLPIERQFEDLQVDSVTRFEEIRKFKERIFKSGSWETTEMFIYGHNIEEEKIRKLFEHFAEFRRDWNSIGRFQKGKDTISTSQGEVKIPRYEIEGFFFNDPYEIMFLYLSRNHLL